MEDPRSHVKRTSSPLTGHEHLFLRQVKLQNPIALKPVMAYIACIGDFKSPTGRRARIKVRAVKYATADNDALRGYFGQMNETTMVLYRMYPCLAVYMRYIKTCIEYTRSPSSHPDGLWDLPNGIRPTTADAIQHIQIHHVLPAHCPAAEGTIPVVCADIP